MPLVSILIPYYNDEKFLRTSIDSVFASSLQDFELILLNHASTDGSYNIAHSYGDPRVKHIDMPKNIGAGGGLIMREMVRAASGKYVKFFCADDQLLPTGLQDLVDYMEMHLDKGFAFGNVQYMDALGRVQKQTFFDAREHFARGDEGQCLRKLVDGYSFLPFIGSIVRKDVLNDTNFDATTIMVADMFVWATLLISGAKIGFLNSCVANYRVYKDQMSAIATFGLAKRRSYFEVKSMRRYFIHHLGKHWTKMIYAECPNVDKIETDADARYVLAEYYMRRWFDATAYLELNDMLQDDAIRARLEEKFGFGIRELRALYSNAYVKDDSLKGCVRRIRTIILGGLTNLPRLVKRKLANRRRRTM